MPWHDNKRRQTTDDCCYYNYLTVVVTARLVSAPLNPIPTRKHLRTSHLQQQHSYRPKYCLERGFWSGIPASFHENSASRTSVIATPNIVFFPNPPSRAQILPHRASWVTVKSRIPLTFPESRTVFWSNPGSRKYPSRPYYPTRSLFFLIFARIPLPQRQSPITRFLQDSENPQVRTWFSF